MRVNKLSAMVLGILCSMFSNVAIVLAVPTYTLTDLGTLGGTFSIANGINASGQVVGTAYTSGDTAQHAFLYSGSGPMQDLGTFGGTFSQANGINNSGQVVGFADISGGTRHAFLFSGIGPMQDLNDLIAPTSGWILNGAQGVNDLGQIVGYGTIGGQTHAFLLTSIPEPSTLILLGIAAISLLGWAWQRRQRA
jgi:probable HAF family extracellular repeat protein